MLWTKIKRVLKAGWKSFARNGSVSLASTLVMTVTLSVILALLFTGALLQSTLLSIKEKVDINIYFEKTATDAQIQAFKKELDKQPEVASTTYTSAEQALANFKIRHQDNSAMLSSIDEIATNPLEPTITVRANDPSQYQTLADYIQTKNLSGDNTVGIIKKASYQQNKDAIDALTRIIRSSERLGLFLAIFFVFISILITFNTVRLAIYVSKDEIAVMRLVGASARYIKGPFVIVGVLYGIIGATITLLIAYPIAFWVGPLTYTLGTGLNLFTYYLSNIGQIGLIIFGSGIILGIISSYLAVMRYIKV